MNDQRTVKTLVRLPADVRAWLQREAERNLSSQTSEIVRALRFRIEAAQRAEVR